MSADGQPEVDGTTPSQRPATRIKRYRKSMKEPPPPKIWNKKHLPWRITSDLTAAACASGLVAPVISMIDRSIVERTSIRKPLLSSLKDSLIPMLTQPHRFLASRQVRLIFAVYFGTYTTANVCDTTMSTMHNKPGNQVNANLPKFLGTSTVNMSLCLYKDYQYARIFSKPAQVLAPVPFSSIYLWATRDACTVFASFIAPTLLAPYMPSLGSEMDKHVSKANFAQFLAPAAMQILSTPIHLLGLDLFNRPTEIEPVHWKNRLRVVARDYLSATFARMGRIIPAFGVGGVVNASVRQQMMGQLGEDGLAPVTLPAAEGAAGAATAAATS